MKSETKLSTTMDGSRQTSSNETSKLFSRTKLGNNRLQVPSPKNIIPLNPQHFEKVFLPIKYARQSQKTTANLLRNFFYRYIRRIFHLLKQAIPKPNPNLSLLIEKRKRLIHSCFLSIFSFSFSRQFSKLSTRKTHRLTAKIIGKNYNILEKNSKKVLFTTWKQFKIRQKLAKNLVRSLNESWKRSIKRYWLVEAFTKIKIRSVKVWQRGSLLKEIPKVIAMRDRRILLQEFAHIYLQILAKFCKETQIKLLQKQQKLILFNKYNKDAVYKLREQTKLIRMTIEQTKNAKNSQQKKKDKDFRLAKVKEQSKKLESKLKVEIKAGQAERRFLNDKETEISFHYQLLFRCECAESACFQIVRILMSNNQNTIQLQALQHLVSPQLMKAFTQSVIYLQMENRQLQKKINFFEKVVIPTLEVEYYEIDYENKVLKELISCFIQREYCNYKHVVIKNKIGH